MRDPKRIKPILKLIEVIWATNPDLRLCQLIGNCFVRGDNYFNSDDYLLERLQHIYHITLAQALKQDTVIDIPETTIPVSEKKSTKKKRKVKK